MAGTAYLETAAADSLAFCGGSLFAPTGGMLIEATFNDVTRQILSGAIEVHRILGPGLLESTYMPCLQFELAARNLRFVTQRSVPIVYKGMRLDAGYRIDLMDGVKRVINRQSKPE